MHNIPMIEKDELLGGYLFRLHDNSVNALLSNTYKELFGRTNINIDSYIPNNMDEICRVLFYDKNAEQMILDHTLFKFYTAFYSDESKRMYMKKMMRPKTLVYALKKGKEIEVSHNFRYCPRCIKEGWYQSGNIIWNRIHQVVPVCTKHKLWIEESTIPTRAKLSNYVPSFEVLFETAIEQERECNDSIMLEITQRIEKIIRKPITVSERVLKEIYKQKLSELGIAYETAKTVKSQVIRKKILKYFTEERLSALKVDSNKMRWLDELLGNYRFECHPLYHILMQTFLEIDPHNLGDEVVEVLPTMPCYCLNPLSSHYKRHIIDNVEVHYSYSGKCYMCTCCCSCGFKFTTELNAFNESESTKIGKVHEYGQEYFEHLLQLRFLGIKGIARLTGIGVQRIRAQLRRYDMTGSIEIPKKASKKKNVGEMPKKEDDLSIKDKGKGVKRKSNDWSKKDKIYCQAAKEIVKNEMKKTNSKPRRLTRTRFAKEIGNLNAILYCIEKLPQTDKVIEENIESKEEYKVRRISWAINRLSEDQCEIKPWRIMRLVRNDNWSKEEVSKIIEKMTGK